MKFRIAIFALVFSVITGTSFWLVAQDVDSRPVSSLMPSGALLYLEAKDFSSLLKQWDTSPEKRRWIGSTNYKVVSMSRLVARLSQAQNEFADLAGIPVGMNFTNQIAGTRSGFAFYDLSKLSFVYITQLPQSGLETTSLWRSRTRYQTREVAGIPFYVKANEAGARSIAFTSYKEWFILATSEQRMAETLVLLSGAKAASLSTDSWFVEASAQSKQQGDLRLVYNLQSLLATPQFRTYWIQRNSSELKAFRAGISDLFESPAGFEERRALLRASEIAVSQTNSSLSDVLAYAPSSAALYRAWSMPDSSQLSEAVQQVVSSQRPTSAVFNAPAPEVTPESGSVGNETDLETRIDEPAFQRSQNQSLSPLIDALSAMQPTALLHVQTTTVVHDQVFVMPNSGLVLICKKPDQAALDQAIAKASALQTGDLDPLRSSVSGQAVIVTRLDLPRSENAPNIDPDAVYTAVYNHREEWPRYKKLFKILDTRAANPEMDVANTVPTFFSSNVQSLGDSLAGLTRASIVTADSGGNVIHETVSYQMQQP